MPTLLCFDFGTRRIGVATGETELKRAFPLATLEAKSPEYLNQQITAVVKEWQPQQLIVGRPVHADGKPHKLTKLADQFAKKLAAHTKLPVLQVDERYSSLEAEDTLREAGVSARDQRATLDAVAAQAILQRYFDEQLT